MPELPEVECLRRSIEPGLLGRTAVGVTIRRREVIAAPGDPNGGLSRHRGDAKPARFDRSLLLVGGRIETLRRHGKQLAVIDHRGHAVIVQLGMTGRLDLAGPTPHPRNPLHTHVIWRFDDSTRLRFVDPRRFGLLRLAPHGPDDAWKGLGPDALTIRASELQRRLCIVQRPVKAALLDQGVLAGVGNIYADEALHVAGIHPARLASSLARDESTSLASEIRRILRSAIKRGGSTIRDYRDGAGRAGSFQDRHLVYGRGGMPCLVCGCELKTLTIAQRTTVLCPHCQPEFG